MKVGFHPVADNPIRIGHVPAWTSTPELVRRVEELASQIDGGKVIPAPWEPFYEDCRSYRDARAFAWARSRLRSPACLAVDLAFFPADVRKPAMPRDRANLQMLRAEGEQSVVTGELMLIEALELWKIHETEWLVEVLEIITGLGIKASAVNLRSEVRRVMEYLKCPLASEPGNDTASNAGTIGRSGHAFDSGLLEMDGWTPDPGTVFLPVDGGIRLRLKEMVLLNHNSIALLRGRRVVKAVPWEKVTSAVVFDGALRLDQLDGPPLVINGLKNPDSALQRVDEFYRAATERVLQAVATQVIRTTV